MLFTIQAYLEDYLSRRNLVDSDGYAVRLANLYYHKRSSMDACAILNAAGRIRTTFYMNNDLGNRFDFEQDLMARLDRRYQTSLGHELLIFPNGTEQEKAKLRNLPRRTVGALLQEFGHAVEARAIDVFWESRTNDRLRPKPEKIAQSLLAVFLEGVLEKRGFVLREFPSGVGFVDMGVVFSRTLHLIEVKVLTCKFEGPAQLEQYMKTERRKEGSLLIVDTLPQSRKLDIPESVRMPSGVVKVYRVNINPPPPSSLR